MSMRYQAGIVLPGYNALKVANAPTIGTATQASCTSISVTFTAPSCVGGGAISSYTVFANCGVKTASGASSPITVTGLSAGVPYTFKTIATNAYGPSYPSAASNSVTIPIITCATYTTAGTYSWVAPTGVTSVAVLAIGGGGGGGYNGPGGGNAGGGGGGLGYVNNYSVTPGNTYTVRVGAAGPASSSGFPGDGGQSYFVSTAVVKGCGGSGGYCIGGAPPGGNYVGTGGGNGGAGGRGTCGGGGGGAGGYAGNGGAGAGPTGQQTGGTGSGGGGGGGASGGPQSGGGGGGVGLYGQGSNGAGGSYSGGVSGGGAGGSSGTSGQNASSGSGSGSGGVYGGGAGGTWCSGSGTGGTGGKGAVRIVWCTGGARGTPSFPSTNVGP